MIIRGEAITGLGFALVAKSDGSAVTSGTATAYLTIDGAAQAETASAPTHMGNGQWSLDLTAEETDGEILGLAIVHTDAVPVSVTIATDPVDLSDIKTQTDLISSAQVVVRSSWSGRGAITIYRDEDTSGSNAWTVTADASEPDFTGGSATMEVRTVEIPEGENEGTLAATFTGAITAARTIAISATATEKDDLQVGSNVYAYKVIATTAAGVARAIAVGNVIVR